MRGYTKTIISGNLLEIYEFEKGLPNRRSQIRKTRNNKGYKRSYRRRVDNVARLRKAFIRLVRSNLIRPQYPALLTLTVAQSVRIEVGYDCLTRFIKRCRAVYGQEWAYIAVPEFQRRGAIHFHLLVWDWPDKAIYDERDTRNIQRLWSHGFCDVLETDGRPQLATYMGKYLHKAVCDPRLLLQKAYVSSRNILRPMQTSLASVSEFKEEWGGDNLTLQRQLEYDTLWLGRCKYQSYLIN